MPDMTFEEWIMEIEIQTTDLMGLSTSELEDQYDFKLMYDQGLDPGIVFDMIYEEWQAEDV